MQARYKLSNKNVSEFLYSCYEKDKRERERERGSKKGLLAATKTRQNHPFLLITSQLKLFALFWTRNARLSTFRLYLDLRIPAQKTDSNVQLQTFFSYSEKLNIAP